MIKCFFMMLLSVMAMGYVKENSFTPSMVKFRVESIDLSTAIDRGQPAGQVMNLFSCTQGDCFLNLTNNQWLDQLSVFRQIKAGDYRYLTVTSCSGNTQSFVAELAGTVNLDGNQYITHPTQGLIPRVGAAPAQVVPVTFNHCQFYNELQVDLSVQDSIEEQLTLYVDMNNIAWGRQGIATMGSGCFQGEEGDNGILYSVCMGVPHMVPIHNEPSPTAKRYNIYSVDKESNTAGGQLVLFMSPNQSILGGFARRIFSNTSEKNGDSNFDTAIKRVQINDDGTYDIKTTGHEFGTTMVHFPSFNLGDHDNKLYYGDNGVRYHYRAKIIQ